MRETFDIVIFEEPVYKLESSYVYVKVACEYAKIPGDKVHRNVPDDVFDPATVPTFNELSS